MKHLLPILALLPSVAIADSLQIHLASDHTKPGNFIEKNYGIGYLYEYEKDRTLSLSLIRNSFGDPALFGCHTWGDWISAGGCLVAGYENTMDGAGEMVPAPILSIRPLNGRVSPRINVIPGIDNHVISVGIDITFED